MIYSNIFPFHADTWGTVSDWAAVIVYGVTGYLIFRTLKSQLKVQELQQKYTQIETYNHIQNIQPIFNLETSDITSQVVDETLYVKNLMCQFKLNNNIAKNVSCEFNISVEVSNIKEPSKKYIEFINSLEGFSLNFQFDTKGIVSFLGSISYWIDIDFYLNYEDREGNKYHQKCNLTITQARIYVKSEHPISI